MANSVQASRVEEATNLYAISDTCTIAIRESLLCDELDGLARASMPAWLASRSRSSDSAGRHMVPTASAGRKSRSSTDGPATCVPCRSCLVTPSWKAPRAIWALKLRMHLSEATEVSRADGQCLLRHSGWQLRPECLYEILGSKAPMAVARRSGSFLESGDRRRRPSFTGWTRQPRSPPFCLCAA
jgi:hypothetical protein